MAYIDRHKDNRSRLIALAGVAAVHSAIGIALVVGLTYKGLAPTIDVWDPFVLTPDPPKPPPPPESKTPEPTTSSVVTAPLVPIPLPKADPAVVAPLPDLPTEVAKIVEIPRPPLPTPVPQPAAFVPKVASPANRPATWVTTDDYPRGPLMDEIEGTVGYSVVVGTNGRVSACEVTASSGNRALDQAACREITRRARFDPATDDKGAKVVGSYRGSVRWEIPE